MGIHPTIHGLGRDMGHGPGGIEEHRGLGDLKTHPLKLIDHLTKGLSPRGIGRGDFKGRSGGPDGHHGRPQSFGDHHRFKDLNTLVQHTDNIFLGNFHI